MFLVTKAGTVFVVMSFTFGHRTASSIQVGNATELLDPERGAGSLAALQHQSRFAILLRGGAFRPGGEHLNTPSRAKPCNASHVSDQLSVTQSLVDMIVLPLERASHTVDIYLAESSNCSLLGLIAGTLGEARVHMQKSFRSTSQRDGVLVALESFYRHAPFDHAEGPGYYDVVIVSRFDLMFKSYINEWPNVNFRAFNFFSRCAPYGWEKKSCVNDVMWVMPGKYVRKFHSLIGHGECFRQHGDAGHWCYKQVVHTFGLENVGFVTDWMPGWKVRESNRWADLF